MVTTTADHRGGYAGPAALSFGFRPFFLGGAVWAALAVGLWLPMLSGHLSLPSAFAPLEWHVHELLYGFVPAIIAGFLLTALPNWTGRPPVSGWPLLSLFLTWLAGRLAVLASQVIGPEVAAAGDLLFLAVLSLVIARELIASGNSRNLKVLTFVALLLAGNGTFHAEALSGSGTGYGTRLGIAAILLLIMLIGGRIIVSFTRNWLAGQGPGRLPRPFGGLDVLTMTVSAGALLAWVAWPAHPATGVFAAIAGLLNLLRLARWAGERTLGEPLLFVLHLAFAFVPLGFLLLALSLAVPGSVTAAGAVHGWTAGAIGLMTLAVMTRASLGHSGRRLTATGPVRMIYLAALVAALARILAAFDLLREPLLHLSALAWVLAFGSFAVVYFPMLLRQRL